MVQAYKDQGLGVVFVMTEDDGHSIDRDDLLDNCCREKEEYGLTCPMVLDPGRVVMEKYFVKDWWPLDILLDDEMVIRFIEEGIPTGLSETIEEVLAEE